MTAQTLTLKNVSSSMALCPIKIVWRHLSIAGHKSRVFRPARMNPDGRQGAQVEQSDRILLLFGTFLPLFGVIMTAFLALVLKHWWRVAALIMTPLLTYGLCDYFGSAIADNGNMLFVALLGVFMVALCIYYPMLLITGFVLYCKQSR